MQVCPACLQSLGDCGDRRLAFKRSGQALSRLLHFVFGVGGPFNGPQETGGQRAGSCSDLAGGISTCRGVIKLYEAPIGHCHRLVFVLCGLVI